MRKSLVPLKDSIVTRLLRVVFSFYLLLAVSVTVAHIAAEYVHTKNLVIHELDVLEHTFQPSLQQALWELNNKQLQSTLTGIMQLPNVVGIEVVNHKGEYLGEMGKVLHLSHSAIETNFDGRENTNSTSAGLFWNTFKVNHLRGDRPFLVGAVTIYSSHGVVIDEVKFSALFLIINAIVKIVGFWILFLIISRNIISKPLSKLTSATEKLHFDNLDEIKVEVKSKGNDELKILGDAFNGMVRNLLKTRSELYRNRELLETRIAERTSELNIAKEKAERANLAKSAFLANMSHELRTPLNAILGFSGMMRSDPQLTAGQVEDLDIINRSGEHLLALINDVLEVAKIEAGRMKLEPAPFDLGGMIRDVTDMMCLRAEQKGLFLELDQSSEFPRYIQGDEARLRQILINLIGNAVKFTEQGGITLHLDVKQNNRRHLRIEVKDTGPGIRQEDQAHIFEPFMQVADGAQQQGSGLGLTITKQVVELMGGNISVESSMGKGTLFRIDLPVELAEASEVAFVEHHEIIGLSPGQPNYRILITEDQRENQVLLRRLMEAIGLETRIAENGRQCLEIFPNWRPDLIWMDRRMPVMDGMTAAQQLRSMPGGESVKIVAVTASAFREQHDEMLAAGMDDVVCKPYRPDEIYDCLARHLGLEFLYRDEPDSASVDAKPPTGEQIAALPKALRQELEEALLALDSGQVKVVLEQIGRVDAELAAGLAKLADKFDYAAMQQILGGARR